MPLWLWLLLLIVLCFTRAIVVRVLGCFTRAIVVRVLGCRKILLHVYWDKLVIVHAICNIYTWSHHPVKCMVLDRELEIVIPRLEGFYCLYWMMSFEEFSNLLGFFSNSLVHSSNVKKEISIISKENFKPFSAKFTTVSKAILNISSTHRKQIFLTLLKFLYFQKRFILFS